MFVESVTNAPPNKESAKVSQVIQKTKGQDLKISDEYVGKFHAVF